MKILVDYSNDELMDELRRRGDKRVDGKGDRPVTGKLRLEDLQVVCPRCDGTGWEDGCSHGAYSMVAHVVDCGSHKVWPCPTHRDATIADWVEVGRQLGAVEVRAKTDEAWRGWMIQGSIPEPGTYLLIKLPVESPTPKEEQ